MTPYHTPAMPYADAVTRDIATQIVGATHVSLSRDAAPKLGPWRQWAGVSDDYYPSPMASGERPVGWVIVPTRKHGDRLCWCESWRQSRPGLWHAQIVWIVGEYLAMTDAELQARKEYEQARADQERTVSSGYARAMRTGNAWANISRIVDEQRRRVVDDILRAGAAEAVEVVP